MKTRSRASAGFGDFRVRNQIALPTLAGPPINEHTALTISAVWNAVNLISNAIACLDSGVAERTRDGGRRPATELPLFDLLSRRPNDDNTAFRFRRSIMCHALTTGNGYAEIEGKAGDVAALHLLEPRNVEPRYDPETKKLYYRLIREQVNLPPAKVIHVANFGWDGVKGYSPITLARETLGLAKAQEQYQSSLMGNGAKMGGIIELPRPLKEVDKNRLRSDFEAMHRGTEQSGTVGIFDNGMKWVANTFSPEDAQVLLSRNFSVAEVARLYSIPQHMIGLLEHATFSNIEQQLMEFYTFTLLPWLTNIEQELDTKVFSLADRKRYFVFHDIKTLLRADTAATTAQDTADFNLGYSMNEIRKRRGDNPIDNANADKHYIPVNNLMAIEDIGEASPAEAEPTIDPGADEQPDERSALDVLDAALNDLGREAA